MLKHENDFRAGFRKIRRIRHLRREHLEVEAQAIVGETADVAADCRIGGEVAPGGEAVLRVFVPMQLHSHAAHEPIARKPIELRAHVLDAEVGVGDNRMRPARRLGRTLYPGGLVLVALARPVGLHIDRLDDAGARDIGAEFLDRIVAADRLVGAEDPGLHRPGEPGQVGLPPDVVMAVDHGNHAALPRPSAST